MKTIDEIPADFELNIDTANEEIVRLAKRVGQAPPDFIPNVYDAHEKIVELKAQLAKKADVVVRPTPKLNVAPQITDPPAPKVKIPPTAQQPEVTGLQRCINANTAKGGQPVRTVSSSSELTGLSRAIAANIRNQKNNTK